LQPALFEVTVKVPRILEKGRVFPVKLIGGILLAIEKFFGHELGTRLLA